MDGRAGCGLEPISGRSRCRGSAIWRWIGGSMLGGQIVWITGAGSGIGRACAIAFAAAGARIALTGRRAAPLEETAALTGRAENTLVATADLVEPGQLEKAHQRIAAEWGDPD